MVQILGTIKDSGGNTLTGKLEVKANYTITDTSTTPDSIFTTKPFEFTITNGVVNINLKASDIEQISYRFSFKVLEQQPDGQNEYVEIIGFDAIVPNVTSIQFSSLLPTDFTVDQLDTGKYSIARIIATTEDFASAIRFSFKYRGAYNSATLYSKDDVVISDGSSYVYVNSQNAFNNAPPNYPTVSNTYWTAITLRGATGTGTAGNNTVYGSTWLNQTDAPSRNAVYNKIETLLPATSPNILGFPTCTTFARGDVSNKLATTEFVNSTLNAEYFRYSLNANFNTVEDTTVQIPFDLAHQSNPNYSTSTGDYTAPFDGVYNFSASLTMEAPTTDINLVVFSFYITRFTGGGFQQIRFHYNRGYNMGFVLTGCGSTSIFLNQGDKIGVRGVGTTVVAGAALRYLATVSNQILCSYSGLCLRRF